MALVLGVGGILATIAVAIWRPALAVLKSAAKFGVRAFRFLTWRALGPPPSDVQPDAEIMVKHAGIRWIYYGTPGGWRIRPECPDHPGTDVIDQSDGRRLSSAATSYMADDIVSPHCPQGDGHPVSIEGKARLLKSDLRSIERVARTLAIAKQREREPTP